MVRSEGESAHEKKKVGGLPSSVIHRTESQVMRHRTLQRAEAHIAIHEKKEEKRCIKKERQELVRQRKVRRVERRIQRILLGLSFHHIQKKQSCGNFTAKGIPFFFLHALLKGPMCCCCCCHRYDTANVNLW
jgi:hypothetical protein